MLSVSIPYPFAAALNAGVPREVVEAVASTSNAPGPMWGFEGTAQRSPEYDPSMSSFGYHAVYPDREERMQRYEQDCRWVNEHDSERESDETVNDAWGDY